ncbi:hypothetical protein PR048_014314 [Dryococelus australis]|uniref:Uncharacterized protein n=1 Tax=Dryococelus australis TaxID=614101 RepID=A0ABQ9HEM5_9NEOP|nr:hypothetical protein PR048_014314 [Dryococelus australis]
MGPFRKNATMLGAFHYPEYYNRPLCPCYHGETPAVLRRRPGEMQACGKRECSEKNPPANGNVRHVMHCDNKGSFSRNRTRRHRSEVGIKHLRRYKLGFDIRLRVCAGKVAENTVGQRVFSEQSHFLHCSIPSLPHIDLVLCHQRQRLQRPATIWTRDCSQFASLYPVMDRSVADRQKSRPAAYEMSDELPTAIEISNRQFRRSETNFISISSPALSSNGATVFCVDLTSDRCSNHDGATGNRPLNAREFLIPPPTTPWPAGAGELGFADRERGLDNTVTKRRPVIGSTCAPGCYSTLPRTFPTPPSPPYIIKPRTVRNCEIDETPAAVARRHANCALTRTGFNPRPGHRIFASENRAGRRRWSAGFIGDIPFPPPLNSGAAPYSLHSPLIGSHDFVHIGVIPNGGYRITQLVTRVPGRCGTYLGQCVTQPRPPWVPRAPPSDGQEFPPPPPPSHQHQNPMPPASHVLDLTLCPARRRFVEGLLDASNHIALRKDEVIVLETLTSLARNRRFFWVALIDIELLTRESVSGRRGCKLCAPRTSPPLSVDKGDPAKLSLLRKTSRRMEQRWNAWAGETGYPREYLPTSRIFLYGSRL